MFPFISQARQTAEDLNVKLIHGYKLCGMILNSNSRSILPNNSNSNKLKSNPNIFSSSSTGNKEYKSSNSGNDHIPFKKCPICGHHNVWFEKATEETPYVKCADCNAKWMKDIREQRLTTGKTNALVVWRGVSEHCERTRCDNDNSINIIFLSPKTTVLLDSWAPYLITFRIPLCLYEILLAERTTLFSDNINSLIT